MNDNEKRFNGERIRRPVWPTVGANMDTLLGVLGRVFVDASFVRSPAFAELARVWREKRAANGAPRYYFIPTYERAMLTEEEIAALDTENCKEYLCDGISEGFEKIKTALGWSVIWLTADSAHGNEIKQMARAIDLPFFLYSIDRNGIIRPPFKPVERKIAPTQSGGTVREENGGMLFRPTQTLAQIGRTVSMPDIPKNGDRVSGGNGAGYVLGRAVMSDHYSVTYATDNSGLYAKIYTAQALSIDIFEKKADRMLSERVEIVGVCWPLDKLCDAAGRFVGILVPASYGIQLTRSVLSGASGLKNSFPDWTKRELCALARRLVDTACRLHELGILFGCFNPASVYVKSPEEVYFTDTDCWQIEGYPVLSQNITFTPPELAAEQSGLRLYTLDQDNYQVALLTFMIMMPGKYPYAKRRKGGVDAGLRDMSFTFSIGGDMRRSEDAERPDGVWQIVWDHLPYKMCESFYNTFRAGGKHAAAGTRLDGRVWLELISAFEKQLDTPEGEASRALFPATFRQDGKRVFERCSICGQMHPTFYFLRNIRIKNERINVWDKGYRVCLPCAVDRSRSPDACFTCKSCGRTFYYTNRTQITHAIGRLDFDWSGQKWCGDCKKHTARCADCGKETPVYQMREFEDKLRNIKLNICSECFGTRINGIKQRREEAERRRNEVYTYLTCRQCGRSFAFTRGEAEFYAQRGILGMPTRCPSCKSGKK